jgi:hypothetical protein
MSRLRILVFAPDCNPEGISILYVTYSHAAALAKLHDVALVVGAPVEDTVRRAKEPFRTNGMPGFDFDPATFTKLINHHLGPTVLLTNRMGWTAEQVVAGYAGQQQVERVFRGLKERRLVRLELHVSLDRLQNPHPCVLLPAGHLLAAVCAPAGENRPGRSFCREAHRGVTAESAVRSALPAAMRERPDRAAYIASKRTLAQQALAKALKLDELQSTQRG